MLYAESPARRARQVASDLLVLAWVGAWIWFAVKLHGWVGRLAAIGDTIQDRGQGLADELGTTADKLHKLPFGDRISEPLTKAATAAQSLASAGQAERRLIHNLAMILVIMILIGPVALAILSWLSRRIRWMTAASSAARLRQHAAGTDVLALRALASQPLRRLAKLDASQLAAWRHGQPAAVHALAGLELRHLGLHDTRPDRPSTKASSPGTS